MLPALREVNLCLCGQRFRKYSEGTELFMGSPL